MPSFETELIRMLPPASPEAGPSVPKPKRAQAIKRTGSESSKAGGTEKPKRGKFAKVAPIKVEHSSTDDDDTDDEQ